MGARTHRLYVISRPRTPLGVQGVRKFRGGCMKRRDLITIFGGASLLALMPLLPAWADLNMQPGLWESSTMVGGETRSTEQKCYVQKDVEALEKFQKGQSPLAAPCRASGYKALGNTTSYTLTC